jgi:hypothetical protein
MRISKELIEKYHDGLCSPLEKEAVENWLNGDAADEAFEFPGGVNKEQTGSDIWNEIAGILPVEKQVGMSVSQPARRAVWRQAAAVLLVGAAGLTFFFLKNRGVNSSNIIVVKNTSETINKDLEASEYTLSVGPNSNIEINNKSGVIDFCGAVMINPKKDLTLTIQGTCEVDKPGNEKHFLKKGLTYIALNYKSSSNPGEVLILDDGSLMGLPPLMKRQLMHQFNI